MSQLFDLEVEKDFLGFLLNNPDIWPDLSLASDRDFSPTHSAIFSVVRQQLDQTPQESVATVIVAEKLKSYGSVVAALQGVEPYDYIDSLKMRTKMMKREQGIELLRSIKRTTVRRELVDRCDKAKRQLLDEREASFDRMVGIVDQTLSSVQTEFVKSNQETEEMFSTLESRIEERGNKPIDPDSLGYGGVFPSVDRSVGPPIGKGHFVNVTARTAAGKSAFGFFYNVLTAEKHDIPVLWVDAGEMTLEQLQMRAVCCLSEGRVPLWAVRSGKWRENKEWEHIIRKEVWPRVKKLRLHYRSLSGLSPKDKVAFMRRFYYNKIGRGNFLAIVDDYLKGVEHLTKESSEWQAIGYYVADVKNLVTAEIDAGFWTSTQANRMGITKGKKAEDIVDNDSVVSISDRINHNATHSFLLRPKVTQELSREKNLFGNMALKVLKIRDGLGKDFEFFTRPIKTSNGFVDNYFNVDYHGFYYRDKGWYSEALEKLGHTIATFDKPKDETIP